ncbi:hypothetical protein [Rudaeicoccus suwonensis]|uniref:ANTAR domain-containing protein n=1 Tax=Rudaeicoccus suwonensis TaxID=657409 RepID=A0A561ECE7_9MICO|nr:hypothetical protein [Rudaeicoccus suwonensis]TWE13257.1 hypothetical protein BKA23_2086 [Rudaeicoccus suwonensis]
MNPAMADAELIADLLRHDQNGPAIRAVVDRMRARERDRHITVLGKALLAFADAAEDVIDSDSRARWETLRRMASVVRVAAIVSPDY